MSSGEIPERASLEPSELVGSVIAQRYALQQLVSAGANTFVYHAIDNDTGRIVTLKLLRPAVAASPSFRERFDAELRAVSALSHPNIVALYDWGITPVGDLSTAFVVTETLGGGSMRDMLDRGRHLSPSQALVIGLEACRGLDYAHRRGFVHTELTPSKVVFGDDRRARIADFGLARLLGAPGWKRPETVDNHVAWYSAPEQGAGGPIDGRTDVYALCLSLHEAVTGELPFKTDSTVATLAARVGKLMPVSADLGPLAAVFERAGRPDLTERATAAQLGKGLVQAASKLPRPEPLPLLSSGLFETPIDQLRDPDDPTGGVTKPPAERTATPFVVVPATPDEPAAATDTQPAPSVDGDTSPASPNTDVLLDDESPDGADEPTSTGVPALDELPEPEPSGQVSAGDDLVILPVDSDLDGRSGASASERSTPPAPPRDLPETAVMGVTPTGAPSAEASEPPRRRRFPWMMLLALFVAAALIVLGVLATQLFETPTYEVPDLVGVPEAEARNLVAAFDWDVSVNDERSDEVPDSGHVIRTVPAAGVELAEGEPFLLVVSQGPVLRELPDSTGLPLVEAQNQLVALGLVVGAEEDFDEDVPPGVVISWSVPGDATLGTGSEVLPGTRVELVVSRGPAPRSVPNLIGLSGADARSTLDDLRLGYVESGQEFSDDVALGHVISQSPDEGVEVERGDDVSVVVSRGPDLVTFPDLSGADDFEEAAEILREAGFVPNLVFGDSEGEIFEITIDGEEPQVGDTFRRGTEVDIEAI